MSATRKRTRTVHTLPEEVERRKQVGEIIARIIDDRRMTVTEVAKRAGLSRGQLYRIIRGHYTMRFTTLEAIQKALKVNILENEAPESDGAQHPAEAAELTPDERNYLFLLKNIDKSKQKKLLKMAALAFAGIDLDEDEDE